MYEIIRHFSDFIPVSEELEKEIGSRIKFQHFKNGAIVHSADQICFESNFIQKGLLRLYFLKEGKEISEYFCSEGDWVNSPRSFMFGELDHYYIGALEDTDVFSLHVKDLMYLFDNFPEMERYARLSMGAAFYQLIERVTSMQCGNASEKYEHFCRVYKDILPRLPLGMIASYLGITQETLSRVRARR
jgi:CRP-like cAMP-binding protein